MLSEHDFDRRHAHDARHRFGLTGDERLAVVYSVIAGEDLGADAPPKAVAYRPVVEDVVHLLERLAEG